MSSLDQNCTWMRPGRAVILRDVWGVWLTDRVLWLDNSLMTASMLLTAPSSSSPTNSTHHTWHSVSFDIRHCVICHTALCHSTHDTLCHLSHDTVSNELSTQLWKSVWWKHQLHVKAKRITLWGVTLNNPSDYQTNGHYWTPNANPNPSLLVR